MSFCIDTWMKDYQQAVESRFDGRIWFIGLQGSYGRGEATEQSDIDVVLILDQVSADDLQEYSALLCTLPNREKVCGFISGKEELIDWEPSDLFQFCYDTTPVVGSLTMLMQRIRREDIRRAVHIGACNVYHMCAHNLVHEKSADILRELYKSAVFTLQAIAFLQSGVYEKQKAALQSRLRPEDRCILEASMELKERKTISNEDLSNYSARLLEWASKWIRQGKEDI